MELVYRFTGNTAGYGGAGYVSDRNILNFDGNSSFTGKTADGDVVYTFYSNCYTDKMQKL